MRRRYLAHQNSQIGLSPYHTLQGVQVPCCESVCAIAHTYASANHIRCLVGTLNVLAKNVRSLDRDARTHALNLLLNLTVRISFRSVALDLIFNICAQARSVRRGIVTLSLEYAMQ